MTVDSASPPASLAAEPAAQTVSPAAAPAPDMWSVEEVAAPQPLSWRHWATVGLVSLGCSTVLLAGYHTLLRGQLPPAIASVDLQGVVEAKELQFTEMVTRAGVTDADRERAYQLVARLPAELESAINELRADCRCLVLVRAAVVGPAQLDLTSALRQKLGIAELDVSALRERLRVTRLGAAAAEKSDPILPPASSGTRPDGSAAR